MEDSGSQRVSELARRVLDDTLSSLPADRRQDTLERVVALVEEEVTRERQRCVGLCRHRAEVWQKTPAANHPSLQAAREEARARHNEAKYLADLIDTVPDRNHATS